MSCSPSFAIRWLVPHLGDLREQHPDLEVHIAAEDALVAPGARGIDVCIRFGAGPYQGVNAERLTRETVTPVCSPLYRTRHQLDKPADLVRGVLLHDDVLVDHPAHVGWREWIEAAEIDELDASSGLHFSHSHLALDAAAGAQGVALARRSLVRADLAHGRLVTPFSISVESGLTYWLVTPRGGKPTSALTRFRDWLRETLGAELD